MRLRVAIILILCGFGITPVLLAVAFNAPAVFGRLEQAAQQESLAVLQREQCALQMRVERIKERIGSLATLPGARDILGLGGADAIALETARSRFSGLVNRWYGKSREVLDIRLTDSSGREYLHLARNKGGKLAVMDDAGQPHPEPAEFIRRGVLLPAGEVLVSEIEVDHGVAAEDLPHVYALSLVTPVVVEGQTAGMLFCRINLTDFLKDYTRSHLWLSGAGGELHQHDASGTHHHAAGEYKAGGERFPGLPAMLKGNEAVIWQGQDRSKVAWQPVLFNGGGPATLWLGHLVDRTVMDRWQREQRFKVLAIVLGLVVVVILLARRIGLFVDRRQGELLTGLENMLAGDRAVAFSWGYVRELKQLASELNGLGERYRDMRFARERAEAELREQNNRLGEMVDRRTAELFATNEQLSEEVEERMQVEEELLRHRHHLEELVRHRVSELAETNEHLQLEILRRQKAQDALAENEARVRAILDSVDIGIIIVDRESRTLTYLNPAAAAMLGAPSADALGGKLCHDYFCMKREKPYCPCIDGNEIIRMAERELTRVDGTPLAVLKTVVPMVIDGRPALLESITDISELKRMTAQNQTLRDQLLQSQKMEAIGVLAGGVAHDFNNLLTIIHGSADLALLDVSPEREEHKYLMQIREATERAGNLVRQLLLFSRTQPATLSSLQLNGVVENLLKMVKRLIGEDIVVATDLSPDLWPIKGDAGNIEQIVMNLAVNGRDAMVNGGTLTIVTANVELDEAAVQLLPEARPGRFVRLSVADTGMGMEEEVLLHIFEPFFTTKEAGKGTGLGLAVVYGIARQHGGWIEVASTPGQGSSFTVYLPAGEGVEVVAAPAGSDAKPRGEGERVLVVEDDEMLRNLVAQTLRQNGYQPFVAANAAEAFAIFAREEGRFDLLFSDVVLPGDRNGLELADELRAAHPALPILLTSGYSDQKSRGSIIVERSYDFLQKPFSIATLLRVIHDLLTKKGRP